MPVCGSGAVVSAWSLLIRRPQRACRQAETPLIVLCRFPGPALRFVVRFNAKVKVGPVEQHLVSKGFPDAKEISLLIQFDRVISEWITRAIIRAGRRRETNHNCDNRYKCSGMHIQNALV